MAKKGVVASQISWIFVIIVGVLILTIFLKIAVFHKTISEARIKLEIASRLKTSIQIFSSGGETEVTLKTSNAKIENSCGGIKIFGRLALNMNIFSDKELSPHLGQLFLFTKKFEAPFYVTNLVMLVEPETKFIFVNNSKPVSNDLIESITNDLPIGINIEQFDDLHRAVVRANTYKDKVKIISFVKPTSSNSLKIEMRNKDVSVIYVQPYSNQPGSEYNNIGNITYYTVHMNTVAKLDQLKNEGVSFYLGFPSLTAASVSNKKIYDCNFDNVLKNLHYFIKIYSYRYSELIKQGSGLSPTCSTGLSRSLNIFHDADSLINSLKAKQIKDIKMEDIKKLYDKLNEIDKLNNDLIYYSCPEMY